MYFFGSKILLSCIFLGAQYKVHGLLWGAKYKAPSDPPPPPPVTFIPEYPLGVLLLATDRKALVDDCGLTLQTRWREKRSKRGQIQFPVAVSGSKTCHAHVFLPRPEVYNDWVGSSHATQDKFEGLEKILEEKKTFIKQHVSWNLDKFTTSDSLTQVKHN